MNIANNQAQGKMLERYAINLNQRARDGKLDPVIGRDDEIRRVLQILSRRTKNNPEDCPRRCSREPERQGYLLPGYGSADSRSKISGRI